LQTRFEKQRALIDEKNAQIDDLKESVGLKLTVADDF